jgi:hypothetical protein
MCRLYTVQANEMSAGSQGFRPYSARLHKVGSLSPPSFIW